MFCGNCGAAVKEGARFCSKCGKPLQMNEEKIENQQKPQQATQSTSTQYNLPTPTPQVFTQSTSITEGLSPQPSGRNSTYELIPKGSFWPRVAAAIIDHLILTIVFIPIYILLMAPKIAMIMAQKGELTGTRLSTPFNLIGLGFMIVWSFIALIISAAYYIYFIGSRGQTPGKMLLQLKVVPTSGGNMDYGKATIRYLAYFCPAFILSFIPCIGFLIFLLFPLWVCWDKQHQGLHDKIAKTYVIRI